MALTDKNIPQCNDEGQASEPDFGEKALMRANIGEKAEKKTLNAIQVFGRLFKLILRCMSLLFMQN